ncbi:MAG: adenylosuccinate lyase [Firmicutes bacterium]|nr:adenylosuccinate lyase [Bacillota bacterium]
MSETYINPLETRYSSKQMLGFFGAKNRTVLWRKLWLALAQSQKELGLDISDKQLKQMQDNIENINFEAIAKKEKEVRHDVMAHVHGFGAVAPLSAPIIHLGATSCFVTDNADLLIYKSALELVLDKLLLLLSKLKNFALKHKNLPCLGFTHFQAAQLTTVGKRATLWMQDLTMDYEVIKGLLDNYKLRGVKGATGTQGSFMSLFGGNEEKVKKLEKLVCKKMDVEKFFDVTGQTYPRKFDYLILSALSGLAQSAHKFGADMRLLMHKGEMDEPFEKSQIGSSAMAYKRNPMRSERICSLARFIMSLPINAAETAANQWFERTLDDSANRRIVLPQSFLAVDAILNLYINIADGMSINEKVIEKDILEQLPFMVTEDILMECVKLGGDRQELHERIRVHSMESIKAVKDGKNNDLIARIKGDEVFIKIKDNLDNFISPKNYIGRAAQQTEEFIKNCIDSLLKNAKDLEKYQEEIKV